MSARHLIAPLLVAGVLLPNHAAEGAFGVVDGESIHATASSYSDASAAPSGSPARGPRCSWAKATFNETVVNRPGPVAAASGEMPYFVDADTGDAATGPGPDVLMLYEVRCPYGTGPAQLQYAPLAEYIDRQAVIQAAYDEAVATIPLPSIDVAPAPEILGIVNMGIWMAVDDPGQVNAFASVGPVWASVTARFVGMTWDMGNGDVVECDGLGVPYTGGPADDYSEGPCGYTYKADGTFTVNATGHWEIHAVTSDGVSQMLDPSDRAFSFEYPVIEYVTVGHP
jgi:hypothetical protein